MPQRLAIGNWKMNTTLDEAVRLAEGVVAGLRETEWQAAQVTVGVAVPYPFLAPVAQALQGSGVELLAQDCHPLPKGAYTSAVSVPMLASVGVARVIVGHSERRKHFHDDDAAVAAKAKAVLDGGLLPVICVGETLEQREAEQQEQVVGAQIRAALADLTPAERQQVAIAYEPVWAIGTGRTATPAQAGAMHSFAQTVLADLVEGEPLPVLYGGSVKPANIESLAQTPGVDGVLVGGASLEAKSFVQIVRGCAKIGARS